MRTRITGFKGYVPGVTQEEFQKVLDYYIPLAESMKWCEDKDSLLRGMFAKEGKKSYIIEVKFKSAKRTLRKTLGAPHEAL